MKQLLHIFLVLMLTACYIHPTSLSSSLEGLPENVRDSLDFAHRHHYTVGYNFVMHSDSLPLLEERPLHTSEGAVAASDSTWVFVDDPLVVAAIIILPEDSTDSVWVKVARDQYTMGWVHEHDLLERASPDDPISQFIRIFSSSHTLWFLLFIGLVMSVAMVHLMRRIHYRFLFHH